MHNLCLFEMLCRTCQVHAEVEEYLEVELKGDIPEAEGEAIGEAEGGVLMKVFEEKLRLLSSENSDCM